MNKETRIFLQHIVENIEKVESYAAGISTAQFLKNEQLQDAILRRLEVIGEATKQLPAKFRLEHPAVPWAKMAGLRDKLIHHYFGVDLPLAFDVVVKELPSVRTEILRIMREEGGGKASGED